MPPSIGLLIPHDTTHYLLPKKSLNNAYQLLQNGWGLNLGNLQQQQLELAGKLDLVAVKVRFFPVSAFIAEGELRHPRQIIEQKAKYLDYSIKLPPRSLDEFSFWVNRYLGNALVLSPPELIAKYRQAALSLVQRYQLPRAKCDRFIIEKINKAGICQ